MIDLARHPSFVAADVHTGFIPQHFDSLFPKLSVSDDLLCQAAIALVLNENTAVLSNAQRAGNETSAFIVEKNMRVNHSASRNILFKFNDKGKVKLTSQIQDYEITDLIDFSVYLVCETR